jgi:hypothetical protein
MVLFIGWVENHDDPWYYINISSCSLGDKLYLTNGKSLFNLDDVGRMSCEEIDFGNLDVSLVEDMTGMFEYAVVGDMDISGWDVSSVRYMDDMFSDAGFSCTLDLRAWDVSSLESASGMFYWFDWDSNWDGLERGNVDLSGWSFLSKSGNGCDLSYMFARLRKIWWGFVLHAGRLGFGLCV